MIRKLRSGEYRLYSRRVDRKSGRRRNLGTFKSRKAAEKHERASSFSNTGEAFDFLSRVIRRSALNSVDDLFAATS